MSAVPAPAMDKRKRVELVAAECLQPEDTIFTHTRPRRASVQDSVPRSSERGSLFTATAARLSVSLGRLQGWRLAVCLSTVTVAGLLGGLLGGLLPRHSGQRAAPPRHPDFVTTLVLRRELWQGLNGTRKSVILFNGTLGGPTLRVREGDLVSSASQLLPFLASDADSRRCSLVSQSRW